MILHPISQSIKFDYEESQSGEKRDQERDLNGSPTRTWHGTDTLNDKSSCCPSPMTTKEGPCLYPSEQCFQLNP